MCWNGERRAWSAALTDCKRFSNEAQTRGERRRGAPHLRRSKQLPPFFFFLRRGKDVSSFQSRLFRTGCPPNAAQVRSVIQFDGHRQPSVLNRAVPQQTGRRKVQEVPLWDRLK